MERTCKVAVLTAFLLMTGCNMDLSISSIVPPEVATLSKPATAEFVSASSQFEKSNVRQYLIQASTGSMTTEQVVVSNVRGYKLYQGVQAQFISEDPR